MLEEISMRMFLIRLLLPVLPLMLAACASETPASGGGVHASSAQSDVLAQTSWELARWTRSGAAPRAVPHGGSSGQPITLTFTREQGQPRLSGFAGCNRYAGQYGMANGLLLVPHPPASTRMACAQAGQARLEQDFLAALGRVASSHLDSEVQPQHLTLVLEQGDVLDFDRRADPVEGGRAGAAKLVYVAPQRVPCSNGAAPGMCYQVRDTPSQPWQLWHGEILGFDFRPGVEYRLRVVEVRDANPPADAAGVRWVLDVVVEQRVQGR